MNEFEKYYLSENPFPETAVIDPFSDDDRINGSIFQEQIFEREISQLEMKTKRRINMIYLSGIQFDKGVGKSALLIHHWRKCKLKPNSTSLYLRCDDNDKPKDICKKIIGAWHAEEVLWDMFQKCLTQYAVEERTPLFSPDSVKLLFESSPSLPSTFPLTLYTQMRDEKKLSENLALFAQRRFKVKRENVKKFFEAYLSEPTLYPATLNSTKIAPIEVFGDLLTLLSFYGYERHYLFLDQFEDLILGTQKRGIGQLSLSLKKMILNSSGKVSFYVTLHPNSEMYLKTQEAKDLTGVAPLNTIHRVDVMVLDVRGEAALLLADKYFDHFRVGQAPYATFPVERELVEFFCFLQQGNIRGFLQQMHNCIEYCSMFGLSEVSLSYALENSLELFGREVSMKLLDRFYATRGIERKGL